MTQSLFLVAEGAGGAHHMSKDEAIALIDKTKDGLINPVEMLHWVWLRVILLQIPDDEWDKYLEAAVEILRK